jgi:rubrerythrin
MAKSARDEGFDEIADWFETLAKAERSHANRCQKALDALVDSEPESFSGVPAHHAKRPPLVVANARHSPSYGCALRLDRQPFGALLGHAQKTLRR